MTRPDTWSSRQGLLLLEAVLAAVVIAAGLVFITRGLSSPLKALQTLEAQETLRTAAASRLVELEASRVFGLAGAPPLEGTVTVGTGAAQWALSAQPCEPPSDSQDNPVAEEVVLSVTQSAPKASVRLRSLWPHGWTSR